MLNPLCGPEGAAKVYGPQKGANTEIINRLDLALMHLADIIKSDIGMDVSDKPGSGAAGGLGAGLLAFANAELRSGIDMVCDVLEFEKHVNGADLVITGEGQSDASTVYDKAPMGVSRKATAHNVPTVILAGRLGKGYEELYKHGISAVVCIADRPMTFDQSLSRTEELLEAAADRTMRLIKLGASIRP